AGGSSGGKSEFVEPLARAAAAVGIDGFFFETHINPCEALCDGPNMLNLTRLKNCVNTLLEIQNIIKENK
ncbi:TPA: 3-deoxy-8-phosphooctulonate synthase, partial [Campylobacter jejuni]